MTARRVASVQVSVTDSSGKLAGMLAVSPTRVLWKERVDDSALENGWQGVDIDEVIALIKEKGTGSTGPY